MAKLTSKDVRPTKTMLYADVCPHCGGKHINAESLPDDINSKIAKEIKRITKEVHNGNIKAGDVDKKLLKLTGQIMEDAVTNGFGKTLVNVDWATPDGEMLSRLVKDVWHFSAAKNYQELRDFTLALKDENGKLRNFNDFKTEATKISGKYDQVWLKTEYNHAVTASTTAARWNEYKQNADIMPYLKYQTVGDNNVRDEHALLDGVVRKIQDDFWKTHYPPNGWGCRCDTIQLASSYAYETSNIAKVNIPKMFQTNLAETGLIFPKGHAYYDGVPKQKLIEALAYLPDDVVYDTVYVNKTNGGVVKKHILHGTTESKSNIAIAKKLIDEKVAKEIKLLPILIDDPQKKISSDYLRKKLYGTNTFFSRKNPDALIDGEIFELKSLQSTTYKRVQKDIYKASKQASNIIIANDIEVDSGILINAVNGILNQSRSIKQIWYYDNDVITKKINPNYKK